MRHSGTTAAAVTGGTRRRSPAEVPRGTRRTPASLVVEPYWIVVWGLLAAGCAPSDIDTAYGSRRGVPGGGSVNGTAVLARMFEQAGHRVTTWNRLSPKLEECQTIVWFPDDFSPPTEEQRQFLQQWLSHHSGRTLVYVGRDFDAAITYWRAIQPRVPAEQAAELARRLAVAQATHSRRRAVIPDGESCDWFVLWRDRTSRTATDLSGAWAPGIDGQQARIEMAGRLEIPSSEEIDQWVTRDGTLDGRPRYERLLSSQRETLVGRVTWEDGNGSQLLFVINGSFLLNLPLVNPEHRELAHKLIASCGEPGRTVFLESGEGGPEVFDEEPNANAPTGFEMFTVWPLGVILVHLTALGILACFALFPIFGRPRETVSRASSDFGQHVEALGDLLGQTRNIEYARQKLQAFQEHVRKEPRPARKE